MRKRKGHHFGGGMRLQSHAKIKYFDVKKFELINLYTVNLISQNPRDS